MISLKIKGNKRGNEGVGTDLVAIGDNRFPVIDAQYPGAGHITDFIVIRHLADKSIYTIVTKNVTPSDSSRLGTLLISVAVPVGEQVAGLFQLLIELSGFYKSNYMTYDGQLYHFTNTPENPAAFQEIISRHPVSRYPFKPIQTSTDLNNIAYIFMTPEQIADLLADPMRPEFARFGQIVMVPVPDPSLATSTINIPARILRSYKIVVNGKTSSQSVNNPAQSITISLPETDIHEAASLQFTLNDARDRKVPEVIVDDLTQTVNVSLRQNKKPKPVATGATGKRINSDIGKTVSGSTDLYGGGYVARWEAERRKKNRMILILCGVILLLVIGGLAYIFGAFGGKDEANEIDNIENTEGVNPAGESAETVSNDIIDTTNLLKNEDAENRDDGTDNNATPATTPANPGNGRPDTGTTTDNKTGKTGKTDGRNNVNTDKQKNSRTGKPDQSPNTGNTSAKDANKAAQDGDKMARTYIDMLKAKKVTTEEQLKSIKKFLASPDCPENHKAELKNRLNNYQLPEKQ